MSRGRIATGLLVLAAGSVIAQTLPGADPPPEEDKTAAPRLFAFNPVQSNIAVNAGNVYFGKGNYAAAVSRFEEATRWDDGNADAWKLLGEAQQERSNPGAARDAYRRFLDLVPHAKDATEIRKRLARLENERRRARGAPESRSPVGGETIMKVC